MHGAQLLLLVVGFGVVQKVQRGQAAINLGLEVQHALVIDFVIEHGVAGRALFHELGENAGFVGGFPLVGHLVQDQLAHGFVLPERDDGFLVGFAGGRFDMEGCLFAGVQNVEVV